MDKSEIEKLSDVALKNNLKRNKVLIGIFVFLIFGLIFFPLKDYLDGKALNLPVLIIAICTIGGLFSVWEEYKNFQKEIKRRGL